MQLAIIVGCAAAAGIVVTRKDGPYGILKRVRELGYTFQCSLCTAALVALVVTPMTFFEAGQSILLVPAALGYAIALMALAGVIDLD